MATVAELALAFHRACARAEVPYAFIDAVAVMAWGQPRATSDVDVLATLPAGDVNAFVDSLRIEGLHADPRDFADALRDGSHVTVFEPDSVVHVDVKLARMEEERREIADAVVVDLPGGELRVASAEDTVAYKLLFGSPQDLADARSILVRQEGRLDLDRLRAVARRLGVEDALDDALAEARGS